MRLINLGVATILGTLLVSAAGMTRADETFSDEQTSAVERLVRDYIINNPEILVESLRGYEEKHRQAADEDAKKAIGVNRDALEKDPTSPVAGNLQGNVTLIEFFDYRCGYCKKVVPSIQELLQTD